MFYKEKFYSLINWKNRPNLSTPLGAKNLNKMDKAIGELDERVVETSAEVEKNKLTIQQLGLTVESVSKEIEEVQTSTNSSIDALKIVPTASGSPVHFFDASNMNIENIVFYGESKQETTTGKNELDCNGLTEQTISGVTFTPVYKNGLLEYVNGNGKCTDSSTSQYVLKQALSLNDNEQHILNGCPSGGSGTTFKVDCFYKGSGSFDDTGKGVTFTARKGENLTFRIVVFSGATLNNVKFYPMLRRASITDSTYESYTGGKASPSPDYPQPIESKIVNRVDVLGTNQMPNEMKSQTIGGLTIDSNSERIKVTGTTTKTVTVSVCETKIESKKGLFIKGATKLEGLSYIARIHNYSTGAMQYWGIGTNGGYIAPGWTIERVYIQQNNADVTVDAEIQPQIVVGNVDLPFEPYQSQTVNLSEPIELNGIGGVRDTDKLKKFGVVVFDGSDDEGWHVRETSVSGKSRNTTLILQKLAKPYATSVSANLLCTNYKAVPSNSAGTWGAKQGMCIDPTGTVMVYDETFNTSDISLWKAHLQANPMTVVYELAEPIETALPQADIDAIKNLHSYKPNTVVMNDGDAEMEVSYVADGKLYIDRKFEALASAIVNQ